MTRKSRIVIQAVTSCHLKLKHSSPKIDAPCEMNRLFRTGREYFTSTFVTHFNAPRFFSPISHFHSPSETPLPDSKLEFLDELDESPPSTVDGAPSDWISPMKSTVRHLHPWPEWVDLMEILTKKGYLEEGDGNPFQNGAMGVKEANRIRTACLDFTRDRFDLIRYWRIN